MTEGTDGQARGHGELEEDGKTVNGQGADTDTLVASARAYVNALNKLLVKRERTAPAALIACRGGGVSRRVATLNEVSNSRRCFPRFWDFSQPTWRSISGPRTRSSM